LRKQLCYAGRVWCTPGLSERICYGIDIDCKYVDVAVQRWEKVSGKVAKLASNGRLEGSKRMESGFERISAFPIRRLGRLDGHSLLLAQN